MDIQEYLKFRKTTEILDELGENKYKINLSYTPFWGIMFYT